MLWNWPQPIYNHNLEATEYFAALGNLARGVPRNDLTDEVGGVL